MSFRKERKFRLTSYDAKALRGKLLGQGMVLLHPDRKITSQYFDTQDLRAFHDSEEGSLPRYKIRVRWYNDSQDKLALERKVSSIEGRFKTTKALSPLEFRRLKRVGILDRDYGQVTPSVMISYRRSYYDHKDLRITFDTDIRYSFDNGMMQYRDFQEVVEIKAPIDASDDYLESIVAMPASRFSKYSRAFLHRDMAV